MKYQGSQTTTERDQAPLEESIWPPCHIYKEQPLIDLSKTKRQSLSFEEALSIAMQCVVKKLTFPGNFYLFAVVLLTFNCFVSAQR